MVATITVVPTTPVAARSACRVTVAGADVNDTSTYDITHTPTMDEMRYYLTFELGGSELGRSYVFNVGSTGAHEFNSYVFPEDGAWTVRLNDARDDSSVQTQAVTVDPVS